MMQEKPSSLTLMGPRCSVDRARMKAGGSFLIVDRICAACELVHMSVGGVCCWRSLITLKPFVLNTCECVSKHKCTEALNTAGIWKLLIQNTCHVSFKVCQGVLMQIGSFRNAACRFCKPNLSSSRLNISRALEQYYRIKWKWLHIKGIFLSPQKTNDNNNNNNNNPPSEKLLTI